MRFSGVEASLRPLYAGNGGARLRHPHGSVPQDGRDVCVGIGHGQDRSDLLRRGLDAAFERGARSFAQRRFCNCCLGNIGRPGGGILALRGHASIQGSTDIPNAVRHFAGLPADAHVRGRLQPTEGLYRETQFPYRVMGKLR